MTNCCVYTCLFGAYERLNEQPVVRDSDMPFICFTDDPGLQSSTWEIVVVDPLLPDDPARSSREPKMRPHRHLPDFDASLYIDNSVVLRLPPEQVMPAGLPQHDAVLALNRHSFHATLREELHAIREHGFDAPERLDETEAMLSVHPPGLNAHPWLGGIIVRRHLDAKVIATMEQWWAHVLRYSRRDQLTLPLVLELHSIVPVDLGWDNHGSAFHDWPVHVDRQSIEDPASTQGEERWGTKVRRLVRRGRS